jgi:predicted dehydrogenase
MTEPVRWGVLGAAGIALNRVIPAMKAVPTCNMRAIASRQEEKARAAAQRTGIAVAYGSYEALLADPEIEAVYIPLPNHLHVEWCAKAMKAGKHVLCEKPIALTADETVPLLAIRDRTGRLIEEAFAIRNHPQWRSMLDCLRSGEIGEIRYVQTTLAYNNINPDDIRNRADIGGGGLYDLGSYAITGCRYVFDEEPVRAVALMDRDPKFKTDRLASAILEFPRGHAVFTVSTQAGPRTGGTHQHFSVIGSKGWIRAEFPYSHATPAPCRLFIGDDQSIGTRPAREIPFPEVNQYGLQGERFSRLVRGEDVEQFPLEGAIANMRVIDALFRSAKGGGWETV